MTQGKEDRRRTMQEFEERDFDIAIVGMAGRFPKADSVEMFWNNLTNGLDCITRDIETDMEDFINSYGSINKVGYFDPEFFGISESEAELMDPQQRLLLTITYEALENAGCCISKDNLIGLFTGADEFRYVWDRIYEGGGELDFFTNRFYLEGSFATRVSFLLNLTGPSVVTKAACATSLVTAHMACQSLLNYECNVALAGGVSINTNQQGYYKADGVLSAKGYTRPFDAEADGFVPGNGAGILVLKRLSDSIKDHDKIYAIIRGTAINNDGKEKIGFTAPSVMGEARSIFDAQQMAGIEPSDVGYVETHGTGTELGDAIEIQALKKVFLNDESLEGKTKTCALGSVKSNVGHLNFAAGAASLIKTTLMLHNKKLLPTISFTNLNPKLGMEQSPFYVNTKYCDWETDNKTRIAGVSSFGIGGVNSHVVMEETPKEFMAPKSQGEQKQVFLFSAKTKWSLDKMRENLADYIEEHPEVSLENIAYTLQTGRERFELRNSLVAESRESVVKELRKSVKPSSALEDEKPKTVFLFPGSTVLNKELILHICEISKPFKNALTLCFNIIEQCVQTDVWAYLNGAEVTEEIEQLLIMPLVFSVDYAIASMWTQMGVRADYVVGYSLGEYVAACVSGALSLKDALFIVIKRAQCFKKVKDGTIISVMSTEEEIKPYLVDGISVSAYNAKNRLMVSGETERIEAFIEVLKENKIPYMNSSVGKPGHCASVDTMLEDLEQIVKEVNFSFPRIPIISTCTGKNLSAEEIKNPAHWVSHTRNAVRFSDAILSFKDMKSVVFVECGIGEQLTKIVKKNFQMEKIESQSVVRSFVENAEPQGFLLRAIGELWQGGVELKWEELYESQPYKESIPTYPHQEKLYWYKVGGKKPKYQGNKKKEVMIIVDALSDDCYELTRYLVGQKENEYCLLLEDGRKSEDSERLMQLKGQEKTLSTEYIEDFSQQLDETITKLKEKYKTDVVVIPSRYQQQVNTSQRVVFRNEVDEKLAEILLDAVGVEIEDMDQEIFDLNVDSLTSVIISTKIRTVFHIEFTIKDMYQIETIKDLSDLISQIIEKSKSDGEDRQSKDFQDVVQIKESKKNLGDLLDEL